MCAIDALAQVTSGLSNSLNTDAGFYHTLCFVI